MERVILGLGSNRGDRRKNIERMIHELSAVLKPPVETSTLIETEPLEVRSEQPWYFNIMITGTWIEDARSLLECCQEIEKRLGRTRNEPNGVRIADIDILLFGMRTVRERDLVIPHPAIMRRRFCIEGLNELVPDWTFPGMQCTVETLHAGMNEELRAQRVRTAEGEEHGAPE